MSDPPKKVLPKTWIKLVIGLLVVGGFIFFLPYRTLTQWFTFENIVEWVKSAQGNGWTMLVFFAAFTVGVLAFPISIFPIVGGVLFHFWIALPLNILAATSGAWLAFGIARFFGRDAVATFLRGRFKSFDKFAAQQGIKTVFFLRWIGIPPFIVSNYALGLSGIKSIDYLIGTILGISPWMILMTYLAHSFWQAALVGGEKGFVAAVLSKVGPLMVISVSVLLGVVVAYFIKKKKKSKLIPES